MRTISTALVACAFGCLVQGMAAEAFTQTVLYSFCSQQNCTDGEQPRSRVINVNGLLYGTTGLGGNRGCNEGCGTLFSLDPNTDVETVVHLFPDSDTDGYFPSGDLIDVDGILYGTTSDGGAHGYPYSYSGTVFSFDPPNDAETVLYSFCSRRKCRDGSFPAGGMIVRSTLYGTTSYGGRHREGGPLGGTVFSLGLKTGVERVSTPFHTRAVMVTFRKAA